MKIIFKNLSEIHRVLELEKFTPDIFVLNYSKTICFNSIAGIPGVFRAAEELGYNTRSDILLHGRLDIEGDLFLSTLVFKSGELVGVSDCITHNLYAKGRALRIYEVGGVKSGIIANSDILYSGADNCFDAGAKIIFHNTLDDFDRKYYGAYASHMRLTNGIYVGLFSDCAVLGNGKLKFVPESEPIEVNTDSAALSDRTFLKISDGR